MHPLFKASGFCDIDPALVVIIPVFPDSLFDLFKGPRGFPVYLKTLELSRIFNAVAADIVAVMQGEKTSSVIGDPHCKAETGHLPVFTDVLEGILSDKIFVKYFCLLFKAAGNSVFRRPRWHLGGIYIGGVLTGVVNGDTGAAGSNEFVALKV